jgi:hypothetical protein
MAETGDGYRPDPPDNPDEPDGLLERAERMPIAEAWPAS